MSQRNIEALRRSVDARNRGDTAGFLEEIDSEVEWHPGFAAHLEGREVVHRGHDGVLEWIRDLDGVFTSLVFELGDVRELGDRLLAFGRVRGRGAQSGAEVEWPIAYLAEFKDAKMVLVHTFLDLGEARAAAGLPASTTEEENLDLAHRAVDAFNRRDLDEFLSLNDRDVQFSTRIAELDGRGGYVGHDGVKAWWHEVFGFASDVQTEIVEARCVGDHVTVARHRNHGRGDLSGVPMEQPSWQVSDWRDGRAVWWRIVASEAEANAAAEGRS